MTYAQVIAGAVTRVGLPKTGKLSNGNTVSNYDQLSAVILAAEGWLPYVDNPTVFDIATQQRVANGYAITATDVTALYTVSPRPADELARLNDLATRIEALEAIMIPLIPPLPNGTAPLTIAALGAKQAGAIYVGQKITWTDGNVWECVFGPLNTNGTPTVYPQGWAQKTGLPPVIPAWSDAAIAYKIGDLVTYSGSTYRCIQAHSSQAGWTPDVVPALWTKQ